METDHREKKCSSVPTIPNTVVVQGSVHISFLLIYKTRYYVMNQESQVLFFRLRETSGSENQSLPCRSRGIQINIYQWCCYLFIVILYLLIQYFMISGHRFHSPCPQSIWFRTHCGKKSKISLCKSYLIWLMEISFWTEEFRFPYANQLVGIYTWGNRTVHSLYFQSR